MGWNPFKSKTVITVGTTVSRAVEDHLIPSALKTGAIKGIFSDNQLVENILEDVSSSLAIRTDRMYRYGKDGYINKLPSSTLLWSDQGKSKVISTLNTKHNASIVLDYFYYGMYNYNHYGWVTLIDSYGYNTDTNEIVGLKRSTGEKVFLKDMVVIVNDDELATLEAGALDQYGIAATAGPTPERPTQDFILGALKTATPFQVSYVLASSIKILYTWEVITVKKENDKDVTTKKIYNNSLTVAISVRNDTSAYFQASYFLNNKRCYWSYREDAGIYPQLDNDFATVRKANGDYFPFAYFRYNNTSLTTNVNTEEFKSTNKLLKYIGLDYAEVGAAIEENPAIQGASSGSETVEQVILILAVPAETTVEIENRYLFDYFNNIYEATGGSGVGNLLDIEISIWGARGQVVPQVSNIIEDSKFKMALTFSCIERITSMVVIGEKNTHTSGKGSKKVVKKGTTEYGDTTWTVSVPFYFYKKQVTNSISQEIRVYDLRMAYYVWQGYSSTSDGNAPILLIPLTEAITGNYTNSERELLYARSLHYVFNSKVVTKVKWYQQGWFKMVLLVVAVIIAFYDYGITLKGYLAAIAAGTMTVQTVLIAVALKILTYVAIGFAFKVFVKAVGIKNALIIAIIAFAVYGIDTLTDGGLKNLPFAQKMLQVSTGLTNAAQDVLKDAFTDLTNQASEFSLYVDKQTKLLDDARELLYSNSNLLSPFIVFGETADEYYQRVSHYGNIGVLSLDAVGSYVETALTLPKLHETVGDYYV